jgi:hypothetical protein
MAQAKPANELISVDRADDEKCIRDLTLGPWTHEFISHEITGQP